MESYSKNSKKEAKGGKDYIQLNKEKTNESQRNNNLMLQDIQNENEEMKERNIMEDLAENNAAEERMLDKHREYQRLDSLYQEAVRVREHFPQAIPEEVFQHLKNERFHALIAYLDAKAESTPVRSSGNQHYEHETIEEEEKAEEEKKNEEEEKDEEEKKDDEEEKAEEEKKNEEEKKDDEEEKAEEEKKDDEEEPIEEEKKLDEEELVNGGQINEEDEVNTNSLINRLIRVIRITFLIGFIVLFLVNRDRINFKFNIIYRE